MMTFYRFCASLALAGWAFMYAPITEAHPNPKMEYWDIDAPSPKIPTKPQTYGERVGEKALSGFANLTTGILEIPKNIINTTNQSNVIYGFIGGMAKGMVHTAGRMGVGLADLLTFPLATKPIAYPTYVWDDFDVDTTYGDVMRLHEHHRQAQIMAEQPAPVAAPIVRPAAPLPPPVQYPSDANRKIDAIFKDKMRK